MGEGATAKLGYNSVVGVIEEATWGTNAATATNFFEFNSEGMKRNIESKKLDTINNSRDYSRRILLNESVEGSLEMPLNLASDACMLLLKHAMGGTVSSLTISAAGGIAHIFYTGDTENNDSSVSASNMKGLTFTVKRGGEHSWIYTGMKINSLSIKGEIGSPVVMSVEMIGKTGSTTTDSLTAIFADVTPVLFNHVTIQEGLTSTAYSTGSYIGFELSINNNLVSDAKTRELGSRTLALLPATKRDITLKLTQRFDTTTAYTRFAAETPANFKILMDIGVTLSALANSTYSMAITLPKCYYTSNNPVIGDSGVITHELALEPIKDNTTTGYSIQMQVNNATAGY